MDDLVLNEQQKNFFHTFGYLLFPGMLNDCIDEIIEEFESLFKDTEHDGSKRTCILPFADQRERLCALLDDPRLHGIFVSLLGADFDYTGSDGNYYVGDSAWHSDLWQTEPMLIKMAFYLDPLKRETGAIRLIPGSHCMGDRYAESLHTMDASMWGLEVRDVPAVAVETKPGDVVLFDARLKHASFGGNKRRRMFTLNCTQRYPEHKLDDLRKHIKVAVSFVRNGRMYGDTMIRTATPRRMRHLEQVLACGGAEPANA